MFAIFFPKIFFTKKYKKYQRLLRNKVWFPAPAYFSHFFGSIWWYMIKNKIPRVGTPPPPLRYPWGVETCFSLKINISGPNHPIGAWLVSKFLFWKNTPKKFLFSIFELILRFKTSKNVIFGFFDGLKIEISQDRGKTPFFRAQGNFV